MAFNQHSSLKTLFLLCPFNICVLSYKPCVARAFSLWSSPKDASLELALSRNRRWIVNNQIKNIILQYPNQAPPVRFIQKKFKSFDLQGKALTWLKKYPCCFEVISENGENICHLSKRMISLVEEEESVQMSREPLIVEKLAKLLLMSSSHRLSIMKLNELKRSFGFPDDYLLRIVPKYYEMFRLVNYGGRKSSMEVEIISWNPQLIVSAVEAQAREHNMKPSFTCCLPLSWEKSWQRFLEFDQKLPYVSPYSGFVADSEIMEKRAISVVHELLSLTIWKKASIIKLGHFKKEFLLPDKLNILLLKHPGIFYVSNKNKIYTVVLRDGYCESELIEKDPLILVKAKFGELMQEGLHEYNRRHHFLNIEKNRKRGLMKERKDDETSTTDDAMQAQDVYKPEERKRFYRVLFDDHV